MQVTTERPSLSLSVTELDAGSWVMFELTGFHRSLGYGGGKPRRAAQGQHHLMRGNGSLWVKLVSSGDILGSSLVAALVAEPASRSASSQQPACTNKSPRLCPGLLHSYSQSAKSGARIHFNAEACS